MLGDKVKKLRKSKKITQQKLAKSIGLSQSTIGMIEGTKQGASNETLKKLANYFNVTVDYLLGTDEIDDIGYIIKEEREEQGTTQEELSKAIGISKDELDKYENDETPISQYLFEKISDYFGMSFPDFLNKYNLYGDIPSQFNGDADAYEKFKKAEHDDIMNEMRNRNDKNTHNINLNNIETKLINKYRTLDSKGKHTVNTVLDMEYSRCNNVLLAAHEKEGIDKNIPTYEEDNQHDIDIMMNDDEWK